MSADRFIVLSRRRAGSRAIFRLLAEHSACSNLGSDPFGWRRPLGYISKMFHGEDADKARVALSERLAQGVVFRHLYDSESLSFNAMLLESLKEAEYRIIVVRRRNEAERIFSLVCAAELNMWDKETALEIFEVARAGCVPDISDELDIDAVVDREIAVTAWFEELQATLGGLAKEVAFEDFFRDGVGGLDIADEIFEFAGLGPRSARIGDGSLLAYIFDGDQFTLGLLQYLPQIRDVFRRIEERLHK